MTALTYLDTSAVMRRAEGLRPEASPRNKLIEPHIASILNDSSRELACSELTLLEFHNNLTTKWRNGVEPHYDEQWWIDARSDFLDRIADKRIRVLSQPAHALEQVMALVMVATRDYGRALKAWDALHAVVAAGWAVERGLTVEIVTSDSDFDAVLQFAGLAQLLRITNLDVLSGTGVGADRPTTPQRRRT